MNLKNNPRTYSGLDRIAKMEPAQELLDQHRSFIRDLQYNRLNSQSVTHLEDGDIIMLLKVARLALQEARSSRAQMLQCRILCDSKHDPSHRKDYQRLKGQLVLLKVEASKRAEIAAKKARTFRAALKD